MTELNIEDCINETCPWSGKPVQADSLALYGDDVVGFCNPRSRDKFERAVRHFEEAKALSGERIKQAMCEQGQSKKVTNWLSEVFNSCELYLINAIDRLDSVALKARLGEGFLPGLETIRALAAIYQHYLVGNERENRREILQLLLNLSDIGPGSDTGYYGQTLLHALCVRKAFHDDIQLLLEAGAKDVINERDEYGNTPLLLYVGRGFTRQDVPPNKTGITLLTNTEIVNTANHAGERAYQILNRPGRPNRYRSLTEVLLEQGADPDLN